MGGRWEEGGREVKGRWKAGGWKAGGWKGGGRKVVGRFRYIDMIIIFFLLNIPVHDYCRIYIYCVL